ncbi:MAG: flagellar basal body P-ring formation chaperone FlgA [Pseudomonadota bacterium]
MRFFCLLLLICVASAGHVWAGDVIAERTLRVGTIIGIGDLKLRGSEDQTLLDQMLGQEMRRAVYAGHPVTQAHLGPPTLVHRNEIVAMAYRAGGLGIRTEGRALTRGGKGEVVEIMNLSSRQTVRAIVTGPRQVEVQR